MPDSRELPMQAARVLRLPALSAAEMLRLLTGLDRDTLPPGDLQVAPEGQSGALLLLADPFDAAHPRRRPLLQALQQGYNALGVEPLEDMLPAEEAPAALELDAAMPVLWWRAALRPQRPLPVEDDAPLLVFPPDCEAAVQDALPDALLHPVALRLYTAQNARHRPRLLLWMKDDAARGSTAAALLASGRLPAATALYPAKIDGPRLFLPQGMQADAAATEALLAWLQPAVPAAPAGQDAEAALLLAALPDADGGLSLLRLDGLTPLDRNRLAGPLLSPQEVRVERWSDDDSLRQHLQRTVSGRLSAAGMRVKLVPRGAGGPPGASAQLARLRLRAAALQQQIAFLSGQLPDAPELLLVPQSDAEGMAQLLQDLMLAEHPPEDAAHALLEPRQPGAEAWHALLLQADALRLPALQHRLRDLPAGWRRLACDSGWLEAYGGAQSGSLLMVPVGTGLAPLPHAWAGGDGELALRRFAAERGGNPGAGPQLYLVEPGADGALTLAVLPRLGFVPVLRRTEWLNDLLLQGWLMHSQHSPERSDKLARASRDMQMQARMDGLVQRSVRALHRYRGDVEKEAQLTLALLWRELATAMARSAATLKRIAQLRGDGEGLTRVLHAVGLRESRSRRALGEMDVASREAAVALQRLGVALAQVERGEAVLAGQPIGPAATPPLPHEPPPAVAPAAMAPEPPEPVPGVSLVKSAAAEPIAEEADR